MNGNVDARYTRQTAIPGWDQNRLAAACVTVVGMNQLTHFTSLALAAMGVGRIFILGENHQSDKAAEFPLLTPYDSELVARALAQTLMVINPTIQAYGLPLRLLYDAHKAAIPECDLLVEVSNDSVSKQICQAYSRDRQIPLILAAADQTSGICAVDDGCDLANLTQFRPYDRQIPGISPGQVIGGLVASEVRRYLLPLQADQPPGNPLRYSAHPTNQSKSTKVTDNGRGKGHCLVVGAGALGNFASLGVALQGVARLTIVDPDSVEESNLNRQILFYDAVGQSKATALACRLRELCPGVAVQGLVTAVAEEHIPSADLILSCVDNFQARVVCIFAQKYTLRNRPYDEVESTASRKPRVPI